MAQYIKSLSKIELAPVGSDGTTGAFVEVGDTVKGSFQMLTADGEKFEINVEEKTKPIISETTEGPQTVNWSSFNLLFANLVRWFGGSITAANGAVGETYNAPIKTTEKTFYLRVTAGTGHRLHVPRLSIFPKFNGTITSDDAAKIDFAGTVLSHEDNVTGPWKIENPVA